MITVTASRHAARGADCTHLCLQYIVPDDLTTNPCAVKISDQRADWDPDNLTAPVLEPIWEQGAATTGDGGELASAIISRWSTEGAAIFVEDTTRTAFNDFHTFTYDDADSVNITQAGVRATNMLGTRTLEYYSHAPSLLMRADQVHLIVEGMAIQIKAAAAISGSHLGEYVTRRIAQVLYEPLSPELGVRLSGTPVPLYRVILQLDRPRDKGRQGHGKLQKSSTTPHSATEMPYDPSTSGLSATNVQDAIDALAAEIDALPGADNYLTNTLGGLGKVVTVADAGAAYECDLADGNVFDLTLTEDCTLSFASLTNGRDVNWGIYWRGSFDITWPSGVQWANGASAPSAPDSGDYHVILLQSIDGGTNIQASYGGSGAAPPTAPRR